MSCTVFYKHNKKKGVMVSKAFAYGCGGKSVCADAGLVDGLVAFHGVGAEMAAIFGRVVAEGRDYFYIDNGYMRAGKNGYFRVTRGAPQHSGEGRGSPSRFGRLGVEILPWRSDNDGGAGHVVVACQSPLWFLHHGLDLETWINDTTAEIRRHTDREIRIRQKPLGRAITRAAPPFDADLAGAWAVVTFTSNCAVDAILAGVPAIVTGPSAALPMAGRRLDEIAAPPRPAGRRHWAEVLAANQWTLDEMRLGICWSDLNHL